VRRRDRVAGYPWAGSALGNPHNAEKLAIGVATVTVGELTERERRIAVELSHLFSGAIADLEDANDQLTELVMDLRRRVG
jgi:hypothetical protein